MQPVFIILGAGRPHRGEEHVALRNALGQSRVLDWLLRAVSPIQPTVYFVGGYQVETIQDRYPEFTYWVNEEWQTTRSAYSLLHGELPALRDCLVSYSDILIRKNLVSALTAVDADIVIAVDSHWRKRFSGRTQGDLTRCEKVCLYETLVTRLGADIAPEIASAEFLGCVRFAPRVVAALTLAKADLRERLRHGNLSDLIEVLRMQGFVVRAVDVLGDWAELNEPRDLAHFVLGTKAETLQRLYGMVTLSRIEDQVSFTVAEWRQNAQALMLVIQRHFPMQELVIRSSALSEDGFINSNAGAYTSLLSIDGSNLSVLNSAIEQVVASYPGFNPEDQVLVQPMLAQVLASGVVFTRSLSSGAPYYIANYDDVSGSTESITNGSSREHKTLVMRRDAAQDNPNIPTHLTQLLPALREIESLLGYDSLDVEFAITAKGGVHILQVRPIAVDHSGWSGNDVELISLIDEACERFTMLQTPSPFVVGHSGIFGIMPDWNPAEIIGTKPGLLAFSLYRFLIMDQVWATQRAEYGYRDVRPQPLLIAFAGHPYVDVRASFNSFVPASLNDQLATRLVDFYLDWLKRHPHLHDKVEFDVVPTCFALDFQRWETRLIEQGGFSAEELNALRTALREVTTKAMSRSYDDLAQIENLEQRFERLRQSPLPPLEKVWALLHDCRKYGTLPFAHLARSAFVAVTLLRSAVSVGVLSAAELEDFFGTIRTVSHQLTRDAIACASGNLSWEDFVEMYGHLRPGTYDIASPSYNADPEYYLRPIVTSTAHLTGAGVDNKMVGSLWGAARQRFVDALREQGLQCDAAGLEAFLHEAIEGREYAKFAFTRNLSLALDELAKWAAPMGLTREALAHVNLEDILGLRTGSVATSTPGSWLLQRAAEGKAMNGLASAGELPPLLCREADFSVFLYPSTQANFVGSGQVSADCVELSKSDDDVDLTGKIALIPQADPGYDWLFGRQIAGLITMYGGANSHMAIRAAEFGMPAAIGVGETQYQMLSAAEVLELNAANRLIRIIR
ncbi:phosphoenolpyruvate synthase [Pseudomonas sp. YeP6b]|uniref:PEP-utilizing enzyme n=1 Tax=Pseudomonas sp. YeP6b TaxID=2861775 RepID=UPI0021D9CE55|nr:PEP-utilizing enzyme [Pseudomonas sp. YeP6b]UXZ21264.1 phosphoenolpyruvate synthase [Pseudomonas sp. YeP6b]